MFNGTAVEPRPASLPGARRTSESGAGCTVRGALRHVLTLVVTLPRGPRGVMHPRAAPAPSSEPHQWRDLRQKRRSDSLHRVQVGRAAKSAVLLAVVDDALGEGRPDAG